MADKYGSYYNNGSYDVFRAAIRYEITSTSDAVYTIRCRSWIQTGDAHDSGANFQGRAYITDEYSSWVTGSGYLNAGDESGFLGDITKTITRTKETQTITCSGQGWASTWNAYTPWVNATISVPPKPSYAVTFNATQGAWSGDAPTQTKWLGESLKLTTSVPTRSGWTFAGWATTSGSTKISYASGAKYTADAPLNLYAVWKRDLTLSYSAGSGGSGAPASQKGTIYNSQTSVKLTISSTKPTKTGMIFSGWSTQSTPTKATHQPGGSITISANTTLTAYWTQGATKPTISKLQAYRSDSSGTADADSTTYVTFKTTYTLDSGATGRSITYSYKIGSGTATTVTETLSAVSGTHTKTISISLPEASTLSVTATVNDTTHSLTVSRTTMVSTVAYPMTWANGGMSIGIFGMASATASKILQVFGQVKSTVGMLISNGVSNTNTWYTATRTDANTSISFGIGSGGNNRGIWDSTLSKWILYTNSNGATLINDLDAGSVPSLPASKIGSGTLALARGGTASDNTARSANTFFAGPSSGSGNASWRALTAADLPNWSFTSLGSTTDTTDGMTMDVSNYQLILVKASYSTTYWSFMVIPTGQLHASTYRDFYLGGGTWDNSYGASFKAIKTKLIPYTGRVSNVARNMTFQVWGMR